MVLLGLMGIVAFNSANGSLQDIYGVSFQSFESSSAARESVPTAHANVYWLFTWLSNYDEAKIAAAAKEIDGRVETAATELKAREDNPGLTDEQRQQVTEIQAGLGQYRKEVAKAIEYAQIDMNMGITGIRSPPRSSRHWGKNPNAFPPSSAPSRTLPTRLTCSRSMPSSKPHTPGNKGADSPSSRMR